MVKLFTALCAALVFSAGEVSAEPFFPGWGWGSWKPLVSSHALQRKISGRALLKGAQTLEDFAYATPERNRLMGGTAHKKTVDYVAKELKKLKGYYDVTLQPFNHTVQIEGTATLSTGGEVQANTTIAEYSPNGDVTAPLVPVANIGCEAADYPAGVSGGIALISRGECTFALKSSLASGAGAVGAIIYNNQPGPIPGMTLGNETTNLVPTIGLDLESGLELVETIESGTEVIGDLMVRIVLETRITNNVIAQSKYGDKNKVVMLGAHSDSVAAGPGINDNGSGSIGILEVAKKLAKYRTNNAVRFGWWSAEEEGLVGSTYYVENLSAEELKKIKVYLNFDMIASPNFRYGIYDGDGSERAPNATDPVPPPGSGDIEHLFQRYFDWSRLPHVPAAFTGRSDYGPFQENGVASGGLFTGAEVLKTEEEQRLFGGEAGVAYDENYHGKGDNVANLNMTAFVVNTRAAAHATAVLGRSLAGIAYNGSEIDNKPPKKWWNPFDFWKDQFFGKDDEAERDWAEGRRKGWWEEEDEDADDWDWTWWNPWDRRKLKGRAPGQAAGAAVARMESHDHAGCMKVAM